MFLLDLPKNAISDRISIVKRCGPNERFTIADLDGCGCINHIWVTPWRKKTPDTEVIFRIYFDNEKIPYVEAPIGDFFGVMHGESFYPINTEYFTTLEESGYNTYIKMPFSNGARIEIETGNAPTSVYMMVDWHYYPEQTMQEKKRFCARWRHENPTHSYSKEFLMLDADGPGKFLGFFYGVRLHDNEDRWSHGGAENIYIDGEEKYSSYIRGIGGEDSFGTSYGGALHKPETRLYSGLPFYIHADVGQARPAQRLTGYRFYDKDGISFEKSIHMRFGSMCNEICSTVFWYSEKPVRPFYELPQTSAIKLDSPTIGKDLAIPESGLWYLCGPFPQGNNIPKPEDIINDIQRKDFEKTYPIKSEFVFGENSKKEAWWVKAPSFHNFIDFRHYFRVRKRGVSPTEPGCAFAACILTAKADIDADFYLSWDDHLTLVYDGESLELGDQKAFRIRKVSVKLHEGRNLILLILSNTIGHNHGGWTFAFKAITNENMVIIPELP